MSCLAFRRFSIRVTFSNQILAALVVLKIGTTSASFQKEFNACLLSLLNEYYNETSILVYDATRSLNTMKVPRLLLPDEDDISIDSIVKLTTPRAIAVHDSLYMGEHEKLYSRFKPLGSIFILTEHQTIEWPESDKLFYHVKETELWGRQSITLLIIRNENENLNMSVMAMNALAGNWRWNKAINVAVMIVRTNAFYFFNWMPYRQPDCRWITERPIIEIWQHGGFKNHINLFPPKLVNGLNGCTMRTLTSDCVPYTYEGVGFEETVVETLEKSFNFTREYKQLNEGESLWTTYYANGTLAGAFAQLYTQKVDLAYGCLMLTSERYTIAETLPCFFQDSLTWYVPTPTVKSHAQNIFEAFPKDYWIIIVLVIIITMCVILLLSKLQDFILTSEHPNSAIGISLRVFAMAISSPITVPSKTVLLRIFTFMFSIYSLHITTIYQASLYQLYKSRLYENVYTTIEQAVDDDLLIWLRSSQKNMYNQSDLYLWKKILREGHYKYLPGDPIEAFEQVAYKKTAAVLFVKSTMQMYMKYIIKGDDGPTLIGLPEKFAAYPVTIFLSPGHPIYRRMSEKMNDIVAAGLVEFWFKKEINEKDLESHLDRSAATSLQLEHVGGALLFLGVLIGVAIFVFLVELIIWFMDGKRVKVPMKREERNMRRKLLFTTIVERGREGGGTFNLTRQRAKMDTT